MPLTVWPRNALNSVAANTSVSSTSSMPKRMSGLSEPKRSMASCQVICGISPTSAPATAPAQARIASDTNASTSSCPTKLASTSSCMNSNWRSARRSSSRRQRAIWKYRSMPPTMQSCLNSCGLCGRA